MYLQSSSTSRKYCISQKLLLSWETVLAAARDAALLTGISEATIEISKIKLVNSILDPWGGCWQDTSRTSRYGLGALTLAR